jgi:hypothetical protein
VRPRRQLLLGARRQVLDQALMLDQCLRNG